MAGFSFGMMLGTIISDENTAISVNLLFAMLFSLGGGMYASTGDGANPLIKVISYISPIRFSSELLLRRIMHGKLGEEAVLNQFGYTWTPQNCVLALITFTLVSFFSGWIIIAFKYRNV